MNPQRISFARALPILALLLSYVIIAVPATMTYIGLRHISRHGRGVTFHSHRYQFTISPEHFLGSSITASAEVTSHYIQALNLPGFMTQVAVDRCLKTWPKAWTPQGLDLLQWSAFAFPIACMPFWWFVGLGIDSLFSSRRRPWLVLLLGTALCISFAVIELSFLAAMVSPVRPEATPSYWLAGFGLWSVLFAAFPVAWVRQGLAWQRTRERLHARLSAETQ